MYRTQATPISVSEARKRFQQRNAPQSPETPAAPTRVSRDREPVRHSADGAPATTPTSPMDSPKSRRPGSRPPLPPSISLRVSESDALEDGPQTSPGASGTGAGTLTRSGSRSRSKTSKADSHNDSGDAQEGSKAKHISTLKIESPSYRTSSSRTNWDVGSESNDHSHGRLSSLHVDTSVTSPSSLGTKSRVNWESPRSTYTLPRGISFSPKHDSDADAEMASLSPSASTDRRSSAQSAATGVSLNGSLEDLHVVDKETVAAGTSRQAREAREAFLRGEAPLNPPVPKFDPALKERERDKERDIIMYSAPAVAAPTGRSAGAGRVAGQTNKETDGYVGFANLPNQVFRKSVKRGFEFTLMVVGESGLGKSTLINSMFLTDLYNSDFPGPSQRAKRTVQVEKSQVLLKEGGVQLRLTVVDTPGFGDSVDNSTCWQPVVDYIDKQYEEYLNNESRVSRQTLADSRVHCCLYFISPNGHGLKQLDIEFMKRLHDKVNIIPLIAKADTMTTEECRDFKKTIMNEISQNNIHIYEFPDCDDEEEARLVKKLKDRVPFAVVGSNTVIDSQGRKVRGRVYPWGVVEVENLEHNDFIALRNMLIRTNLQDLKDVTNNVHYENFRYGRLASVTSEGTKGSKASSSNKSPLVQMEEERAEHNLKMKKMEADMEQVFESKVLEKKQKLRESENDLQRRAEQMKRSLEQQEKELQERRAAFEAEKHAWEEQQKMFEIDPQSTLRKKNKLFNN